MKVLFISLSLPPFGDSQTIRSLYLIQRLAQIGFDLTLVSAEVPPASADHSLLPRLPPGCKFLRTPPTRYDLTLNRLRQRRGGRLLVYLYSNIVGRLAVPDARAGWERMAVRLCQNLPKEQYPDVIVSASGSYTAHLAACQLSRQFSVPWVADSGDPWSMIDFKWLVRWLGAFRNRALELATIPHASALVFTTEETLAAYRQWLGDKLPPAVCIPYGYMASDFPDPEPRTLNSDHRLQISHIGVAYRSSRNLIPTIRAVSALEQRGKLQHGYTLNIVGPHSVAFEKEAHRLRLPSVCFEGRVSYAESIEWILRSDALLIVGNKGALQVPGKVFPYLASGRPILYLGQRERETDPAYRLLARFPGVLYAENSAGSIQTCLETLDADFPRLWAQAMERKGMEELKQYEATVLGDRFAELLRTVKRDNEQ